MVGLGVEVELEGVELEGVELEGVELEGVEVELGGVEAELGVEGVEVQLGVEVGDVAGGEEVEVGDEGHEEPAPLDCRRSGPYSHYTPAILPFCLPELNRVAP